MPPLTQQRYETIFKLNHERIVTPDGIVHPMTLSGGLYVMKINFELVHVLMTEARLYTTVAQRE